MNGIAEGQGLGPLSLLSWPSAPEASPSPAHAAGPSPCSPLSAAQRVFVSAAPALGERLPFAVPALASPAQGQGGAPAHRHPPLPSWVGRTWRWCSSLSGGFKTSTPALGKTALPPRAVLSTWCLFSWAKSWEQASRNWTRRTGSISCIYEGSILGKRVGTFFLGRRLMGYLIFPERSKT